MKKLQFKYDGSEAAKKCIEWVNENRRNQDLWFWNAEEGTYYNSDLKWDNRQFPDYTLLTPTEFLREVTGESEVKKVVCISDTAHKITKGKEYKLLGIIDDCYTIENDIDKICTYSSCYFQPVSEPTFQYGQEVEIWGSTDQVKFCCIDPDFCGLAIIKRYKDCTNNVDRIPLSSIRPIPTLKQKIVEVLFKYDMPHSEIADKIIEMVKGGSHD